MPAFVWEIFIILMLILANGFFSGAEIAIIAARRGRLQQLADDGDRPAKAALALADDPNRFLPTVQIGITLVGTFAAAFGGAHLEAYLAEALEASGNAFAARHSHALALTAVVVAITYASVLLGELVPKRLALRHSASGGLARLVARPMSLLASIGRPVVWLMGVSTNFVLLLLGSKESKEPDVNLEDIEHAIKTGTQSGVLDESEQKLALEALRLGDKVLKEIMRPRLDIDALDIDTPPGETLGAVAMAGVTRLPLYEGNLDNIVGFVNIKDVLRRHYLGFPIELRKIMHPVLFVPESLSVDRLLVQFQAQGSQLAIVLDEFGGTEGLVTLQDILEELVGEIRDEHERDQIQDIVAREDGSYLVDGLVPIEELAERLQIKLEQSEEPRGYNTIAGLVLDELERIPQIGEGVQWQGHTIEVIDMDGPRIDRLLVTKQQP
ncbi:MAG: hemolysin family protein [Pirellulales bacterium]